MNMNINPVSASKHGRRITVIVIFSLLFLLPFSSGQVQPTPDRYDPYAQPTFSPSMAIIIVILIAALFFMGFFSIYIRHCSTSDSSNAVRPLSGSQRNRRAATRGVDAAVIQTFPTLVYSEVKVMKIGKGALECAVCLCEFEDDETLRLIPKCDHVFHPECIDAWLASHNTCPVCRANLSQETVGTAGERVVSTEELQSESSESDIEAQNGPEQQSGRPDDTDVEAHSHHGEAPEPQVTVDLTGRTLNRNRTPGSSRSNRPRKFPRSHSTGHSLVQPGENTERFTLRLPVDVRKEIMNRQLNRANSLVVLPRESSSRRGYRTGGEGSSRGKSSRWLERLDRSFNFSFFSRASSLRSPKAATRNELPAQPTGPESSVAEPGRPPV